MKIRIFCLLDQSHLKYKVNNKKTKPILFNTKNLITNNKLVKFKIYTRSQLS